MIQRIQSVYLLIAETLMAMLFFLEMATFLTSDNDVMKLNFNGIFRVAGDSVIKDVNAWPLAAIIGAACFIGLIVIFLYRFRMFQIRLCFFNMALCLGAFVLIAYYIFSISAVADMKISYSIVDVFPLVAIVLYYLAYRAIARDQAKVLASSFRLRK